MRIYPLFLLCVFYTSCGQNQTQIPKDNINSETKDTVTSSRSNDPGIHTKYEYTDSIGKLALFYFCRTRFFKLILPQRISFSPINDSGGWPLTSETL